MEVSNRKGNDKTKLSDKDIFSMQILPKRFFVKVKVKA